MIPRPGVPNGDITGPNGRGLVFRTGTLQARTAEAWCSERGDYRPERPKPGVAGRGHYRTEQPWPGVPNGDITGPNGRTLVFPDGEFETPEVWCSRKRTFQARAAEAWCSPTERYWPRFPARLPTGCPRRLLILSSNTTQIMFCSGSPVLFFAVVAFVVCRRRRVMFLRGAVYDGRIDQAF